MTKKNSHPKKAQVVVEDNIASTARDPQVKTSKKKIPNRKSERKKKEKSEPDEAVAGANDVLKSGKRKNEETEEPPAQKRGKKTNLTAKRYPVARLDISEEEATDMVVVEPAKKGSSNIRAGKEAVADLDAESASEGDISSNDDLDSEKRSMDGADSEVDLPLSEAESEPASEKKLTFRKPSKKALEHAMNERPFFPAKEPGTDNPPNKQRVRPTLKVVKAKRETGDESGDDDDDENQSGGRSAGHDDTTRLAKRIYKKALKILKFKLYFENFFPTDAEKDSLPYSCWTSAVASISETGSGNAALHRMFYDFGFNDTLDKRISSIRSTLVTKSMDCHNQYYPTTLKKSAALKDNRYVYPGDPDEPANTDLVYRNDLICDILKRAFFSGRDTLPKLFPEELSDRINADGYIEMPETLVASAATLIYGLLRRDTLPHADGGWKFSADAHHSTYSKHIKSLNYIKSQNDAGHSVLLANIYRKASGTTASNAATTATLVKMNPAGMSQAYD